MPRRDARYASFLSTPSARRATVRFEQPSHGLEISIHALREEGDLRYRYRSLWFAVISIHALREEGDHFGILHIQPCFISIHALREEGDQIGECHLIQRVEFLSTPSARRATFSLLKL